MDAPQNLTEPKTAPVDDTETVSVTPMSLHGNTYIDFCAVQGMVTSEDGEIKKMTATDFANMIGVRRETLYDWQKRIPDFWDRVQQRRKDLGGQNRIMKVYNGLFLKAAAGDSKAAAIWLANHDPNFRMPSQVIEHEVGNSLADLLQMKRQREQAEKKVIDVNSTNQNNA